MADFPTTLGPQTTGDGVKFARDIGAGLVEAGSETSAKGSKSGKIKFGRHHIGLFINII